MRSDDVDGDGDGRSEYQNYGDGGMETDGGRPLDDERSDVGGV